VTGDILLESSWWGLQLSFRPHLDQRSAHKVMALQSCGILILWISGFPLGSPGTKCHLDVGLMERHRAYYKGEGGGFPQVQVVVSLMSLSLPVVCLSTKSAPTNTYQLVVWFCAGLCEWLMLVIFPSPISELQHALLPPKFCEPTNGPQLLTFPLFPLVTHSLSLSMSLGVRQNRFRWFEKRQSSR
jgi:hypothetical protein